MDISAFSPLNINREITFVTSIVIIYTCLVRHIWSGCRILRKKHLYLFNWIDHYIHMLYLYSTLEKYFTELTSFERSIQLRRRLYFNDDKYCPLIGHMMCYRRNRAHLIACIQPSRSEPRQYTSVMLQLEIKQSVQFYPSSLIHTVVAFAAYFLFWVWNGNFLMKSE